MKRMKTFKKKLKKFLQIVKLKNYKKKKINNNYNKIYNNILFFKNIMGK